MEILIIAAGLIVGFVIGYVFKGKEKKEESVEQKDEKYAEQDFEPDTLGLMNDILCSIGCPSKKNDDGTLSVCYKGKYFFLQFFGMYARIWETRWSSIKVDNDELQLVLGALNIVNHNLSATILLSERDEEGMNWFNSRIDLMLHPACPDNVFYVRAMFDSLCDSKIYMQKKLEEIKSQQMEDMKSFNWYN